ncbi:MAG: PilT/PilU family type 4a pilus ATPase [Xanthomonadaceae bacterium]|nr:PilT/PilU family type 4a pilus ATPase [Xanthomonadaceae bacterium]
MSDTPIDLRYLIKTFIKNGASDMHLKPGRPPLYRINGKLVPAKMKSLDHLIIKKMMMDVLSENKKKQLDEKHQTDFSFKVNETGRFRCNLFYQRGHLSAVVRIIPLITPNIDKLGIPGVVKELAMKTKGLVVVSGPTGSGKSTTLAAMIQYINHNASVHVLCLEDPIEYIFTDDKASITQREIGSDATSFEEGLFAGLRQDPDVIVIGELRDPATMKLALIAAETGHLVFATLHTHDARTTMERFIDVFPSEEQAQIRIQLANVLNGIVSQHLISTSNGEETIATCEIMINSPAITEAILKNEIVSIPEIIAKSSSLYKMQTFNQDLERKVKNGDITLDEAILVSPKPDDLRLKIAGVTHDGGYDIKAG